MLFMVIESFHAGQAPAVYRRFRERGRMAPEGVRYISSWVDLDFRRCFQVMEASSEALLKEWTANWVDWWTSRSSRSGPPRRRPGRSRLGYEARGRFDIARGRWGVRPPDGTR